MDEKRPTREEALETLASITEEQMKAIGLSEEAIKKLLEYKEKSAKK